MRKSLLFLGLILTQLISCTSDDKEVPEMFSGDQFPQKWTLVEMKGNIPNVPPLIGEDMSWQEYYVFNADKTFSKVRDRDGVKSEAGGTYDSTTYSNQNFLELTFSSGADISENCGANSTETLYLISQSEVASTWLQCDGPDLTYKRLE